MVATIVTLLLTLVISLLTLFFSLLPTFDWPNIGAYLSASGLTNYFAYLNWFFPVGLALSITLAWVGALITYKLVMMFTDWLKSIIP